jgi:hypothetical protein
MPRSYVAAVILFLSHFFCDAQFENFSEEWNIPTGSYDAFFGNGVSVFDYDGDNIDNVTIAHPYIGIYGFQVSQGQMISDFFIPLPLNIKQLLWADFNNDGDKELFVTTYGSGLYLFDYTADGLTPIDESFSSLAWGYHYGASAADYDNDGDLDLFVSEYVNYNEGIPFENLLFRNEGNFIFTEVGQELGVNAATDNSFQSVWVDFNRDGWQDLYVINDHSIPNLFYQNNSGVSFTEISAENTTNVAMSCMSNSISDFNRDGFFDIFITDGLTPVLLQGSSSGMYAQVAYDVGFTDLQTGWGALWIDDDFDGWDDIHICQGGTELGALSNKYYINNNGNFQLSNTFDTNLKASYVNAKGDFDGDCYPDFVVMNAYPNSYDVWKGQPNENNYLKIKLEGTISNKDAAGAIVEVYSNSELNMKAVLYGDNYISQSSNSLLFGMGNYEVIDSLCIYWPRGLVEKFYNVEVNQSYSVTEGMSEIINTNLITFNQNYCYNASGFEVSPSAEWVHWQWQDGSADNSVVVFSDTTLQATAWNSENISFDLIYNITISSPWPELSISLSECMNTPHVISVQKNSDWGVTYNGIQLIADSIYVSAGDHFLNFVSDSGCVADTLIQITAVTPLQIEKSFQPACPGELVAFSIDAVNAEILNLNLVGLEYWNGFLPGGTYPFSIIDETTNCEYSDTLFIEQRAFPSISVVNDSICENSMSSFEIEINDNSSADWSIINSEYLEQDSVLSVTIQDTIGCLYSEDVSVLISSYISVFPSEQTMNEQQILSLNPIGGIPPYAIFWQDSLIADSFVLASDGWVVYEVTDQLGCTHIGSYYFQQSSDVDEFPEYFDLFFNGDMLFCSNCNQCTYSILSMNGGLVEAGVFKNAFLNLGVLDKGIYLVRVNNEVLKFVK